MSAEAARSGLNMRLWLTQQEIESAWPTLLDNADRPDLRPRLTSLLNEMKAFRLALYCPPTEDQDTQPLTPVES